MSAHTASSVASQAALLRFWAIGFTGIIDIALSFWIGRRAQAKGRSFWYGFLLSLFFTPLVGAITVGLVPRSRGTGGTRGRDTTRDCPFCTKCVAVQATVCPFCERPLPPAGFP